MSEDRTAGKAMALALAMAAGGPADVVRGYQCDACADRDEGRSYGMEG